MSKITQDELNAWLWEAANIIRGPVDPANLREYVFPLMFFKRINDTWEEQQSVAVDKFGTDVSDEIAADFHTFNIPHGSHWADLRRAHENVGIEVQRILQSIEHANPETLSQIFGNAPWADKEKIPEDRLVRLVEHFGQKNLSPTGISHDLFGGGYEYLLKAFSDESATSAGQFFTPRAVVRLLTHILNPQPTDTVYDPACGSAGMLIEAAATVKANGGSVSQMRFYGQEINQASAAIGRMNLLIHEVEDSRIVRGDTLNEPKLLDSRGKLEQFDVVLANPPFSLKDWGSENWASDPHKRNVGGVPPKGNGDYAWVQHMIASMRPKTGRVGVVMPHGVLFRGSQEAKIRQYLIENDLLEAVISLPEKLFYGAGIPAVLMILQTEKKPSMKNNVLIIDGSKRFRKGKSQNEMRTEDVDALYEAYVKRDATSLDDISIAIVEHEILKENNYDLNIGRYIKGAEVEAVNVSLAIAEMREALVHLDRAQVSMDERLRAASYE
jgi:type I restriction enzyme M protein